MNELLQSVEPPWLSDERVAWLVMVVPHLIGTVLVLHAAWTLAGRAEVLVAGLAAASVVRPDTVDARWCERFAHDWLVRRRGWVSGPSEERLQACLGQCSAACASDIERALRQDAADGLMLGKATLVHACQVGADAVRPGCWTVAYALTLQTWYGPLRGPRTHVSGHLTLVRRSVQAGDTEVLAVDADRLDAQENL